MDKMQEIIDRHPLCLEYETDARDVWPRRWEEARKVVAELESKLADRSIEWRVKFENMAIDRDSEQRWATEYFSSWQKEFSRADRLAMIADALAARVAELESRLADCTDALADLVASCDQLEKGLKY